MPKIFRNIRKKLLAANKVAGYLKYALGEILLVVIGILIALQVNNWNENRKKLTGSKEYLSEIREDLVQDTLHLASSIEDIDKNIEMEKRMLSKLTYNLNDIPLLANEISPGVYDFSLNEKTFQSLNNSGLAALYGYEDIYKKIKDFYLGPMVFFERMRAFEAQNSQINAQNIEGLTNLYEEKYKSLQKASGIGSLEKGLPELPNVKEQNQQLIAFAQSIKGRNYFKINYVRHIYLREHWRSLKQQSAVLITQIDNALNKNHD